MQHVWQDQSLELKIIDTALICIIVLKWKVLFVHQKKQVLATFSYTVQISQLQFQCFAVERYQFLLSTTQSWMFHDKYYPLIFIGCNLIYFTVLSLTKQLIQSCYMLTVLLLDCSFYFLFITSSTKRNVWSTVKVIMIPK